MNEKHLIKLPGTIDRVATLADGSIKFSVVTQELAAEDAALLFDMHRQLGWFVFSPTGISAEDIPTEVIDTDISGKTQSQRLRGALYRLWEAGSKSRGFEDFYRAAMEKFITTIKDNLNQ